MSQPAEQANATTSFNLSNIEGEPSKQLQDMAFASALLHQGKMTERELTRAVSDWSAIGSKTLAEHLTEQGLITSDDQSDIQQLANRSLHQAIHGSTLVLPESEENPDDWDLLNQSSLSRISSILSVCHTTEKDNGTGLRQLENRYTIIRKLGQGGLGTVWLARDESLQRNVAIKEITYHEGAGRATIQRFQLEAEITGQLEHPNIVTVYQFGEDAQTGRAFYAMRFLGKQTLSDAIIEYHERLESDIDQVEQCQFEIDLTDYQGKLWMTRTQQTFDHSQVGHFVF